jgi:hypothetical protein
MVYHDKEQHKEANKERYISCHFSNGGCVFGGDLEIYLIFYEREFLRYIFESIVEVDLFIDFILVAEKSNKFISLSLSFNSHHNGIFGICS